LVFIGRDLDGAELDRLFEQQSPSLSSPPGSAMRRRTVTRGGKPRG